MPFPESSFQTWRVISSARGRRKKNQGRMTIPWNQRSVLWWFRRFRWALLWMVCLAMNTRGEVRHRHWVLMALHFPARIHPLWAPTGFLFEENFLRRPILYGQGRIRPRSRNK
jgi:hypothetical protein